MKVKLQDYKNLLEGLTKNIKDVDLNSIAENLKNLKIDDLKDQAKELKLKTLLFYSMDTVETEMISVC